MNIYIYIHTKAEKNYKYFIKVKKFITFLSFFFKKKERSGIHYAISYF